MANPLPYSLKSVLAHIIFIHLTFLHAQKAIPIFEGKNLLHHTSQMLFVNAQDTRTHQDYLQKASQLSQSFRSYDIFDFPVEELNHFASNQNDSVEFVLSFGNFYQWKLKLKAYRLLSPHYERRIVGDSAGILNKQLTNSHHQNVITFKGYADGNKVNPVRITLKNNFLEGFIVCDGKRIFLESSHEILQGPLKDHLLVYKEEDFKAEGTMNCHAKDLVTHKKNIVQENVVANSCNGILELEIATAATYSLFSEFDMDLVAIENHILAIMNGVQLDYERFNLRFKIVELVIFTEPNTGPWFDDTDLGSVFQGFSSWAPQGFQNEHDIGICFYNGRGVGTIGKAWLATVCRNRSYCAVDQLKSLAANRALVSHEMGHNFSAQHVSGTNIMRASLLITDIWASASIRDIQDHVDSRVCLRCIENTPLPDPTINPLDTLVQIQVKIILEGLYNPEMGSLSSSLLDRNILPENQPFNIDPLNYEGIEKVELNDSSIVEWVYVELRDGNNSDIVVSKKAGILKTSGFIEDADDKAENILSFPGVDNGNYKIAIYQRNHIAILSRGSLTLGKGEVVSYDFTDSEERALGSQQLKEVQGIFTLYGGDFDQNGIINNLDFNLWRKNAATIDSYISVDADGNGIINNLDFNIWKNNRSKIGALELRK